MKRFKDTLINGLFDGRSVEEIFVENFHEILEDTKNGYTNLSQHIRDKWRHCKDCPDDWTFTEFITALMDSKKTTIQKYRKILQYMQTIPDIPRGVELSVYIDLCYTMQKQLKQIMSTAVTYNEIIDILHCRRVVKRYVCPVLPDIQL